MQEAKANKDAVKKLGKKRKVPHHAKCWAQNNLSCCHIWGGTSFIHSFAVLLLIAACAGKSRDCGLYGGAPVREGVGGVCGYLTFQGGGLGGLHTA